MQTFNDPTFQLQGYIAPQKSGHNCPRLGNHTNSPEALFFSRLDGLIHSTFFLCEFFFFTVFDLSAPFCAETIDRTIFGDHFTRQIRGSCGYICFRPHIRLGRYSTHSQCGGLFLKCTLKTYFPATLFGQAVPCEMKGLVIHLVRKSSNMLRTLDFHITRTVYKWGK